MRELFLQRQNILSKPGAMRDVTGAYDEEHSRCAVVVSRLCAAAVGVGVGCGGELENAPPAQAPVRDCESATRSWARRSPQLSELYI